MPRTRPETQFYRGNDLELTELAAYLDDGQSIRTVNTGRATFVSSMLSSDQASLLAERSEIESGDECEDDSAVDQPSAEVDPHQRGYADPPQITSGSNPHVDDETGWEIDTNRGPSGYSTEESHVPLLYSSSATVDSETSNFSATDSPPSPPPLLRSVRAAFHLPSLTYQRRPRETTSLSSNFHIAALSPRATDQAIHHPHPLSRPSNFHLPQRTSQTHHYSSSSESQPLLSCQFQTLSTQEEIMANNMSDSSGDEPLYIRTPPRMSNRGSEIRATGLEARVATPEPCSVEPESHLPEPEPHTTDSEFHPDHNLKTSSSSEPEITSPKLDKGKGKAKETDSGEEDTHNIDRAVQSEPEFKFEDLFEEITYESSDDAYQTKHFFPTKVITRPTIPPAVITGPTPVIDRINSNVKPVSALDKKRSSMTKQPRTWSHISNDGSYASELSKTAIKYDLENDADISAFLRATAPAGNGNNSSSNNKKTPLGAAKYTLRKRGSGRQVANDAWGHLGRECPRFPLREEQLNMPHPVKEGRQWGERLQVLPNGEWLEQAWCSHHRRAEFSATLGLAPPTWRRPVAVPRQHGAGMLLFVVGCLLVLAVGGLLWGLAQ